MIISIIIILVVFFYIGETKITFNPFSFKIENWQALVGWVLLIIGFSMVQYKSLEKAELRGYKQGTADLAKVLQDDLDQMSEQYKRNKKIKDEKLKTNITNSSNSADESADSTGL